MATLTLTWHAMHDEYTCKICWDPKGGPCLDGYTWIITVGKDEFPKELVHPIFGVVWNMYEGSKAHGHTRMGCRCRFTYHFEFSDMVARAKELHAQILDMIAVPEGI